VLEKELCIINRNSGATPFTTMCWSHDPLNLIDTPLEVLASQPINGHHPPTSRVNVEVALPSQPLENKFMLSSINLPLKNYLHKIRKARRLVFLTQ
jgi:hypothetical protein